MENDIKDIIEFHKSIGKELKAVQNRVRNLIKDANWLEEGRYKEVVLRNVIRRFLPENLNIGTGFILKDKKEISKQIDIIIYDNTYPVLFREGDFVITSPENVKAIIEVKTKLYSSGNPSVEEVLRNATCNEKLLNENQKGNNKKIFNGIFVYEQDTSEWFEVDGERLKNVNNQLEEALRKSRGIVNHICIGNNIFIKFWYPGERKDKEKEKENVYTIYYTICKIKCKEKEYEIKDLAFAYFISNLIKSTSERDLKGMSWFLFPISKGIYPSIDIPIDNNTESYDCKKDCKKQKKKKK
jgi:hypothetical protein